MTDPGRSLRWPWRTIWAVTIAVGLTVDVLLSPLYEFGTKYDDELFIDMAHGFLQGHWSSSWSTTGFTTLAKPVGYPLFLAGAHFLPWSPLVSTYLVYLVGVVLIAWSWWRITRSDPQATLILILLVLNPTLFATQNVRIYRDSLIDGLATVAIGIACVIAANHAESWRPAAQLQRSSTSAGGHKSLWTMALAALLGIVVGIEAVTKPTWAWLVIAIAAPLTYPLWLRFRRKGPRAAGAIRVLLAGLLVFVAVFGVVESVKIMNKKTYHVALVEDLASGAFPRTWKTWASVQAGPTQKFVPITKSMRLAVYQVSPMAARLKPYFDVPGDPWVLGDCGSVYRICNDSGPWSEWDLQTAAVETGRVHSEAEFQSFFNTIADQISTACKNRALRCTSSPVLAPGLPPLNQISLGDTATNTVSGMWQMVWDQIPIGVGPPNGTVPTTESYKLWKSVIPSIASTDSVERGSTPTGIYQILRILDRVYGLIDVALLVLIGVGILLWCASRIRRTGTRLEWPYPYAASIAVLSLLAALVGMTTLAVFQVSQAPGFITPLYWTDFATPAELFLVFGAIAARPLIGRRRAQVESWAGARRMHRSGVGVTDLSRESAGGDVEVSEGSNGGGGSPAGRQDRLRNEHGPAIHPTTPRAVSHGPSTRVEGP